MLVYMFNLSEEVIAILDSEKKEIMDLKHHKRINATNEGDDNYLEITIPATIYQATYFIEGNYLGFLDLDDNFQMFRIVRQENIDDGDSIVKTAFCPHVVYELRDSIVEDKKPRDVSAETCISSILSTEAVATRWSTGDVDSFGSNNINFYYQSAWNALLNMRQRWSYLNDEGVTQYGIIEPRLVFSGSSISARYIDFKKDIGTFRGKVFTIERGLNDINRDIDISEVATALYPFGKGEEIEQSEAGADSPNGSVAYGRGLTIEDIAWQKADSDLYNQNFEDGLDGWTTTIGSATVETSFCNVGTQCIKLGITGGVPQGYILSDSVNITAGNTYNGRCLVFAPNASTNAIITLFYYNSAGASVASFTARKIPNLNTWTLLRVEGLAPATAVTAKILIYNPIYSGGELFVDKARLGDYTTKPLGQSWIEDVDAKAKWGYDGGTRNIFKKFTNGDTVDSSILAQQAWIALQKLKEPKISYTLNVMDLEFIYPGIEHEKIRIGDICYIQDLSFNPVINIAGRVNELIRDYMHPESTNIVISNFFEESLNSMITADEVKDQNDTTAGIWNNGTLFETTPQGNNRMRLVEVDTGEFASELRYEDDEGNLIGYFNSNEFQYKEIYGGNVYSQNLLNVDKTNRIYYVNSTTGDDLNDGLTTGTAWRTLNRAKNALPKVLLSDILIYVKGSTPYYETLELNGYLGSGLLQFQADIGVSIQGQIKITSCQCPVFLKGGANTAASDYWQIHSVISGLAPIEVYSSQKVRLQWIWANCNSIGVHGVRIDASNLAIDSCVTSNAVNFGGITALDMANVNVKSCRGSGNKYGIYSINSSHAGLDTTYPIGATSNKQTDGKTSVITDLATATATAEPTPPANPTQKYKTICIASNSDTYNIQRMLWEDNNVIKQGSINSTTGNNYGFMYFNDTNKFSALAGKTIYSAKLYIKRLNGGLASARTLTIYGHNYLGTYGEGTGTDAPQLTPTIGTSYGNVASIKWQEELSFYMPSTFLTEIGAGSVKGLVLYVSSGSPYVQLDGTDTYSIKVEFMHS